MERTFEEQKGFSIKMSTLAFQHFYKSIWNALAQVSNSRADQEYGIDWFILRAEGTITIQEKFRREKKCLGLTQQDFDRCIADYIVWGSTPNEKYFTDFIICRRDKLLAWADATEPEGIYNGVKYFNYKDIPDSIKVFDMSWGVRITVSLPYFRTDRKFDVREISTSSKLSEIELEIIREWINRP